MEAAETTGRLGRPVKYSFRSLATGIQCGQKNLPKFKSPWDVLAAIDFKTVEVCSKGGLVNASPSRKNCGHPIVPRLLVPQL